MTIEKAQKHLENARMALDFWRGQYLYIVRNESYKSLRCTEFYSEMIKETMQYINEAKKRIAKFERIVK